MGGDCDSYGAEQNRTGMGPHGKPRNRWENIINTYLKQIGWDGINCIYLTPDREK